jgi:hypothetical protein
MVQGDLALPCCWAPSEGWREKEETMPSKTEVVVWGFVVISMCIVVMGMMNPWS